MNNLIESISSDNIQLSKGNNRMKIKEELVPNIRNFLIDRIGLTSSEVRNIIDIATVDELEVIASQWLSPYKNPRLVFEIVNKYKDKI